MGRRCLPVSTCFLFRLPPALTSGRCPADDEGSGDEEPFQHAAPSEDGDADEDADEDEESVQAARNEDSSLPTDFTGFLGRDKKK